MEAAGSADLLALLASPWVQALLLTLSVVALLFEVTAPGSTLPAAASGLFFVLFLAAGLASDRVAPEEIAGFGLGFLLVLAEWKLAPGHGIAGAGGLVIVLASVFLALLVPSPSPHDLAEATMALLTCLMLVGGSAVATRPWQRLAAHPMVLRDRLPRAAASQAHLVGCEGIAVTDCRPAGRARFGQEVVPVIAEDGFVSRGARVVGRSQRASELVVAALPELRA